jgi:predicted hotdog family 3-hydroxylacyl-ACP dehydratase
MIPHTLPMRFPLFGGPLQWRVRLPDAHPLCVDGVYPTVALVELAAQAAGWAVVEALASESRDAGREPAAHGGMLVEVESATCERPVVPAGEVLTVDVQQTRVMGALRRYTVHVHGVLRVGVTLRIGGPS